MNPRFLALWMTIVVTTAFLFLASVPLWWLGLVVLGVFTLYASL